jgi:hypothetical protein
MARRDGRDRRLGENGARFEGFKDIDGRAALIDTIAFRTRAAK